MMRRIIIIAVLLAVSFGVRAWRNQKKREREWKAYDQAHNPAMGSMSAERLFGADWAYEGPMGELTLRFAAEGKLTCVDGGTTTEGKWELSSDGQLLSVYFPGEKEPHVGTFLKSTDEMSGMSPVGQEPSRWSAKRKTAGEK